MTRGEGKEPSQRQLRVGEEVRHALAWMLERGEIHDPGLKDATLTVTEVRMSPDLRHAAVFVTRLGGGAMEEVLAGLARARPYLRRLVGQRVRLRFTPDFSFHADPSFDRASRIDRLLAASGDAPPAGAGAAVDRDPDDAP